MGDLAVRSRKRLLESSASSAPCAHLGRLQGVSTCSTCPLMQVLVSYEFIAPHGGFAPMSAVACWLLTIQVEVMGHRSAINSCIFWKSSARLRLKIGS